MSRLKDTFSRRQKSQDGAGRCGFDGASPAGEPASEFSLLSLSFMAEDFETDVFWLV
jgi:hypothetical protein